MREFDHTGFLLAEYQAKLFARSIKLGCSSPIFLRRFLHSEHLATLDENNPGLLSLDVEDGIDDIVRQFGESNYGKEKFSANELFWMGYMYRYISYTREESTPFVIRTFPYKQMRSVYPAYHTQDPEWCIASLLNLNNLNPNYFDKNFRLKEVMRRKKKWIEQ